jgi:undecaprenyl diphosphate synthase
MIKHVAIIMDGNRRWARDRKIPYLVGHTKGFNRIQDIITHAGKKGIKHITFWAFSTENWKRPAEEVTDLMIVFRKAFTKKLLEQFRKDNVRVCVFGDLSKFPEDIQTQMHELLEQTKEHTGIIVNIALNYGGREEILRAARTLIETNKTITEENFSNALYSHGQPDPDLLIRTGGEQRLSGYLPWQSIYSELYFTKTLWPDFDEQAFDLAIEEFNQRNRRFGT